VKGCIWRSSSYFSDKIYKYKLLLHFNIRASLATKKFSNVEYEAEHLVSCRGKGLKTKAVRWNTKMMRQSSKCGKVAKKQLRGMDTDLRTEITDRSTVLVPQKT